MVKEFFENLIKSKENDNPKGIVSICSSNPYVLKAFFKRESKTNEMLLIESTSNQVNQYGGYTGMKPIDFRNYVFSLAHEYGVDKDRIILGGDHLGPNPFRNLTNDVAMSEACNLVKECVKAGYKKIHLDASMLLKGDIPKDLGILDPEISAERAAILCKVAEETALENSDDPNSNSTELVYVIGTEVPVPGGSNEVEGKVEITTPDRLKMTIELTKKAFLKKGLNGAWDRVIGVVCQPGVEFGDRHVLDYDRKKAQRLIKYLKNIDFLVGEAHSTDYQTKEHLRELVNDGFAILKVGPALTFALREALFALSFIENELITDESDRSSLVKVLEKTMLKNPKWWEGHFDRDSKLSFRYSLFDRIRYYWNYPEVKKSIEKLFENIKNNDIPYSLLSQFLPNQYWKIRNKMLKPDPIYIVLDRIDEVILDYMYATVDLHYQV